MDNYKYKQQLIERYYELDQLYQKRNTHRWILVVCGFFIFYFFVFSCMVNSITIESILAGIVFSSVCSLGHVAINASIFSSLFAKNREDAQHLNIIKDKIDAIDKEINSTINNGRL